MARLLTIIYQKLDPWLFSRYRADYFGYLYAVLSGSIGHLTIRELFYRDAQRYGNNPRGRLSARWASLCDSSGGDLYATWLGYLPIDELLLVRVSQGFGNQRLLACFKALSEHLELLIQARQILFTTLFAAFAAIFISVALVLSVPWWTVPALQKSFNGLPENYLGIWALSLFESAAFIKIWALPLIIALSVLPVLFFYSLPRYTGRIRKSLDKFGLWRLYRQINALRFLSLSSILLQPNVGVSTQLRPVIAVFLESSNPWLSQHIQEILQNIEQGTTGAEAFDTDLLDKDLYWYFTDMVLANGLQNGLLAVGKRMQNQWLKRIKLQAQALRWLCLLSGVACVLGLGLWHYAAIDDLRRAWLMFHAV